MSIINRFVIALACLLLLPQLAIAESESAAVTHVRYAQPANSDARYGYIIDLMRAALNATRKDFGDYVIEPYNVELSTQRYAMLLSEGKVINIGWAAPGSNVARSDSTVVPVDIFHGLLGFRLCMVNANSSKTLDKVSSLNDLRNIKIAQGRDWADNPIYFNNNINLLEVPSFESLFQMLGLKRFDCMALGANEIESIYKDKKASYPFLAIDENLLIFYRFPIYFYVSNQAPYLAKRLHVGLQKLQRNGGLESLFKQYHQASLASLHLKNRKLICLESPYIKMPNQCSVPVKFPDVF